ncbi:MAG: hypothetical protein IV100_26455 [Myxococcales bacterium]|nr:hypothetical protein [Myxococcales bacterium]
MSLGIIEAAIVAFSLFFGLFDVPPNPRAASADDALAHMIDGADYAVHVDVGAIVPHVLGEFDRVIAHPVMKESPDIRRIAQEIRSSAGAGLEAVKAQFGVDLAKDIDWVSASIRLAGDGDPEVMAEVHGRLPADLSRKLAGLAGGAVKEMGGIEIVELGGFSAAFLKSGSVVVGTSALVEASTAGGKKPKLTAAETAIFAEKPFLAILSSPSESTRQSIRREFDGDVAFLGGVFAGHELLTVGLHRKGISWTWVAPDLAGTEIAQQASEGLVELFRAGHLGIRGLTRLLLAGLRASDDELARAIAAHSEAILKLILDNTGDGRFDAKIDVKKKDRTVLVKATGPSFSKVFPFAVLVPMGAASWFLFSKAEAPAAYEESTPKSATEPQVIEPAPPARID